MFSACSRTSLPNTPEKIERDPVSVQTQKTSKEEIKTTPKPLLPPEKKEPEEEFVFNPPKMETIPPVKYSYRFEDLKVGAKVGPWKVSEVEQPVQTMPLSKDNFGVMFDREVSLDGTYIYYPDNTPFRSLSVCFFLSTQSMKEMPALKDKDARGSFCFGNKEDFIQALSLKPRDSGTAKIVISSYYFMVAPMEGGYGAIFKKLQ